MIGITVGEAFGIGCEITVKTLIANPAYKDQIQIYGCPALIRKTLADLSEDSSLVDQLQIRSIAIPKHPSDFDRGTYVINQLNTCLQDVKENKIQGLLTGPIDKSIVAKVEKGFDGHTGYLQKKTKSPFSIMVMQNKDFNIVVGTQHIALRNVADVFTKTYFLDLVSNLILSCQSFLKHESPTIAVLSLNPHAGEMDPHAEEKIWMNQTIKDLQAQGIRIQGPFSADAFFANPNHKAHFWDFVISPYHDQALVAAKYNGLQDVVNITLGLPFLRVSPGHGVAYDIAGQNIADPRSFQKALSVIEEKIL